MFYPLKFAYWGEFKEGKRNGFGIGKWLKKREDDSIYEGYWVDGKQNGHGTLEHHGNISEGIYKDGKRTGFGKIYYKNGDLY